MSDRIEPIIARVDMGAAVNRDVIRQIDKTLDVLTKVETMMNAEAEMNATKHLSDVVRPVPLAGAVSSMIGDLEAWRQRLMGHETDGSGFDLRTDEGGGDE